MPTQQHVLYAAGTQHDNLHHSSVYDDERGDLVYSTGPQWNRCKPQLTQEILRRGFGKNASKWIGKVKISKEEIPGSKCSMHG